MIDLCGAFDQHPSICCLLINIFADSHTVSFDQHHFFYPNIKVDMPSNYSIITFTYLQISSVLYLPEVKAEDIGIYVCKAKFSDKKESSGAFYVTQTSKFHIQFQESE